MTIPALYENPPTGRTRQRVGSCCTSSSSIERPKPAADCDWTHALAAETLAVVSSPSMKPSQRRNGSKHRRSRCFHALQRAPSCIASHATCCLCMYLTRVGGFCLHTAHGANDTCDPLMQRAPLQHPASSMESLVWRRRRGAAH